MCLPSTFGEQRRTVVIPMTSQFGCLELLITRTFLSGPVKFEITRVDCNYFHPKDGQKADPLWVLGGGGGVSEGR